MSLLGVLLDLRSISRNNTQVSRITNNDMERRGLEKKQFSAIVPDCEKCVTHAQVLRHIRPNS